VAFHWNGTRRAKVREWIRQCPGKHGGDKGYVREIVAVAVPRNAALFDSGSPFRFGTPSANAFWGEGDASSGLSLLSCFGRPCRLMLVVLCAASFHLCSLRLVSQSSKTWQHGHKMARNREIKGNRAPDLDESHLLAIESFYWRAGLPFCVGGRQTLVFAVK
jgi:hypothetical protein